MLLEPTHRSSGVVDGGGQVAHAVTFFGYVTSTDSTPLSSSALWNCTASSGGVQRSSAPRDAECRRGGLVCVHDRAAMEVLSVRVGIGVREKERHEVQEYSRSDAPSQLIRPPEKAAPRAAKRRGSWVMSHAVMNPP